MIEQIEYRHTSMNDMETRLGEGEDGTFAGYLCRFDVVDSYQTRFAPGAFSAGGISGSYALLWMHDPNEPVGVFTAREDEVGLYIEGRYDNTPEGQRARERARSGSAGELSIGFKRVGVDPDDPDYITAAETVEGSQITVRFASQPGAELVAVRKAAEIMKDMDKDTKDTSREQRIAEIEKRIYAPIAGTYEDRISKCQQALRAWAETNRPGDDDWRSWAWVEATFSDRLIATIETRDDSETLKFDYSMDTEGEVVLSNPTEAEIIVTVRKDSDEIEKREIKEEETEEKDETADDEERRRAIRERLIRNRLSSL